LRCCASAGGSAATIAATATAAATVKVRALVLDIGILLGVTFLGGRTAALSEARRNPCLIIAEPAAGLEIVAVGLLAALVPAARAGQAGPGFGAPAPPPLRGAVTGGCRDAGAGWV